MFRPMFRKDLKGTKMINASQIIWALPGFNCFLLFPMIRMCHRCLHLPVGKSFRLLHDSFTDINYH